MGKRLFDITFSLMALTLGAPLYLFLALMVKISSSGPVFFADERTGQYGTPFRCLKFRTMYVDAPYKLQLLLETNPLLKEEWLCYQKLRQDPRITPIGTLLRKSSLDELPQFINVLFGDMSIVGPRPFMTQQIGDLCDIRAAKILSVRPGITGLWQTSGRSNLSYDQRIALEEAYIDKQGFLFDVKIILKTVPSLLFSKGAC